MTHQNTNERMAELYTEASEGFEHEYLASSGNWAPKDKGFGIYLEYRKIEKPLELWIARDEGCEEVYLYLCRPKIDEGCYVTQKGYPATRVEPSCRPPIAPGQCIKLIQAPE